MRDYDWNAAVRALRAVHDYGLAQDLGSLERAIAWLTREGDSEAAAIVWEWYAVAGEKEAA